MAAHHAMVEERERKAKQLKEESERRKEIAALEAETARMNDAARRHREWKEHEREQRKEADRKLAAMTPEQLKMLEQQADEQHLLDINEGKRRAKEERAALDAEAVAKAEQDILPTE